MDSEIKGGFIPTISKEPTQPEAVTKRCRPRGTRIKFPLDPALRPAPRDCVLGYHVTPYGLFFTATCLTFEKPNRVS
jgi:hypothetical protein